MRRRKLLKVTLGVGAGIGVGGIAFVATGSPAAELTIDGALAQLDRLPAGVRGRGAWTAHQVFAHCAQSVEYSMDGYPQHRSELFKSTIGIAAFAAFAARGRMAHGLAEAIPGAPAIEAEGDVQAALERLRTAMLRFRDFDGPLAHHFAYGALSKAQYEQAHVMHFRNHADELL